jgi:hypothetical protein
VCVLLLLCSGPSPGANIALLGNSLMHLRRPASASLFVVDSPFAHHAAALHSIAAAAACVYIECSGWRRLAQQLLSVVVDQDNNRHVDGAQLAQIAFVRYTHISCWLHSSTCINMLDTLELSLDGLYMRRVSFRGGTMRRSGVWYVNFNVKLERTRKLGHRLNGITGRWYCKLRCAQKFSWY